MADELDKQTRALAAMAYGEASAKDDPDEIFALASVLVRQRDARGYKDISEFASKDRTFSFVVKDGNQRYAKLIKATQKEIAKDDGMKCAVDAAKNALNGGPDKSNGAYFWDGGDIKINYAHHFKVRHGIKFSDASHNIYAIKESTKIVVVYKHTKTRNVKTGKVSDSKEEVGRYDHQYDSTAAHGGTIFWKLNPDYLSTAHAKEYK
jgi:hypothetical protein